MRRIIFVFFSTVLLVIAMVSPAPAAVVQPYGADSFLQSRAENLPVNASLTAEFQAFMRTHPDQRNINFPKINVSDKWAMSYDYGTATDPVWKLRTSSGAAWTGRFAILSSQGFHMADSVVGTIPTGRQDRPVVIIDEVFDYTIQFANAVANLSTRTIRASGPAIFWHSSNGLDFRNLRSDDSRNQSSRGRIPNSMVVTREELDQAVANNTGVGKVLHLYFVETDSSAGFVHPMINEESGKNGWGAEGTRLRINPTVDLVARGLTGHLLALARTLQQNGAYIGDNSGSSTQIKLSQLSRYNGTNISTNGFQGKLFWTDFEVVVPGSQ